MGNYSFFLVENGREVPERDVTLGQIYGTLAILILRQTQNRLVEVVIYLLNGPGLAPQKTHVLRLGHSGRFAMNIVDNLIVVHHQASATSLLFDIALNGETDTSGITYHAPVTPGKTIKPFALKLPSISLDGQSMNCDLCMLYFVLFEFNLFIKSLFNRFAKLGTISTKHSYRREIRMHVVSITSNRTTLYSYNRSCSFS